MPKFYLATRKDRADEARALLDALKIHGWERTFTWTGEDRAGPRMPVYFTIIHPLNS